MISKSILQQLKKEISSKRNASKEWFLSLLDEEKQQKYEERHLKALLSMLRICYIAEEQEKIASAQNELSLLRENGEYSAENYQRVAQLNAEISVAGKNIQGYRHFFEEPYFARMDVVDDKEGYNAYYIGKKGDLNLGIVDWRAPLSRRYYQKSQRHFSINEYDYEVILRRAIRAEVGKVRSFSNETLNVRGYLTKEEVAGRDFANVLDPYLRELICARKDEEAVRDIIETIQEKQFDLITRPEKENFIVQGCAGSGKTMVLLHRLSYLMYNDENLRPDDVLVITPSHSFNEFIGELSQVLELGQVRTYTLQDYYREVLLRAGIDVSDKLNGAQEAEEYLKMLYSSSYPETVEKSLKKVYDEIYGLFTSPECRDFSLQVLADCRKQRESYTKIKNASVRLRRCVLGEIKETEQGNLRYTRPFRDFMNNIIQIEDFLSLELEEGERTQAYFYKQLNLFYRSARTVESDREKVFQGAIADIAELRLVLQKELKELRRYRFRVGSREEYTYPERIAARESVLVECDQIEKEVNAIADACNGFSDFFAVLQGQKNVRELGQCENMLEMARFFYRMSVKKTKLSYGMKEKGLYKSDVYALLVVLSKLGVELSPKHSFVFVDEGQDVSEGEYALLKQINDRAVFNVYGDLKQNITPWRGVTAWEQCLPCTVYTLDQNYRNTNQIVDFVAKYLDADMKPVGFDGADVVNLSVREVTSFFKDKKGIKAVIALPQYLPLLKRGGYNVVGETGVLSKKKINLLSVYESKGLEFSCVAVYDKDMSQNERYIAYTRALKELACVHEKKKKEVPVSE